MKKFNPSDRRLYYQAAAVSSQTTNKITSDFDFRAFAYGNSRCFRSPSVAEDRNKEKKRIIFSSWELPLRDNLDLDVLTELQRTVDNLLRNEFEVYIYTDNGLQQIETTEDFLQIYKCLTIASNTTIMDQAGEQGFVADRTLIVDYFLLSEWVRENATIDLFLLRNIEKKDAKSIINTFEGQGVGITYQLTQEDIDYCSWCIKQELCIKEAMLSGGNNEIRAQLVANSIKTFGAKLKKLTLYAKITGDFELNEQETSLTNLEELDLSGIQCSAKTLSAILNCCGAKLKKLYLPYAKIAGDLKLDELKNRFANLEELNIRSIQCSAKTLDAILNCCGAKLKKLYLPYAKIAGDLKLDELKNRFANLEELNLSCIQCSAKTLDAILNCCGANLKKLDLSYAKIAGDLKLDEQETSLTNLEELDLSGIQCSAKTLSAILNCCGAKLKKLYLPYAKIAGDLKLDELKNRFANLEELNLSCIQCSAKTLDAILNCCGANLKKLDLSYAKIAGDLKLDELKNRFANLEELNIRSIQCSAKTLSAILNCCGATLKKLDLSSAEITGDLELDELETSFTNLEELNVSDIRCSAKTLDAILNCCDAKLKKLDLSYAKIAGDLKLDELKNRFANLEELNIRSIQCSAKTLDAILNCCGAKLKKLYLPYAKIAGDLKLDELKNRFANLEELRLWGIKCSAKTLDAILNCCGATLKKLDLSYAKIAGDLKLDELKNRFANLEELNLFGIECSAKTLSTILKCYDTNLKKLTLYAKITGDFELNEQETSFTNLEELNVSDIRCSAKTLDAILNCCGATLKKLDLSYAKIAGDLKLDELKNRFANLEELNLFDIECSAKTLDAILNRCGATLKKLDLSSAEITGDLELDELETSFTNLEELDLSSIQCSANTRTALKAMGETACQQITELSSKYSSKTPSTQTDAAHYQIDLSTKNNEKTELTCQQYFIPLAKNAPKYKVSKYRLEVMPPAAIPSNIKLCDPASSETTIEESELGNHYIYYGTLEINLTKGSWHYLPSLSPAEKLLKFSSSNTQKIELGYDTARDQYAARLKESVLTTPGIIHCYYLLAINKSLPICATEQTSSEEIDQAYKLLNTFSGESLQPLIDGLKKIDKATLVAAMRKFFGGFTPGELADITATATEKQKLLAFITQKHGSCRHRSWAFYQLAKRVNLECRMVKNDCHRFVEVHFEAESPWQQIELGGYSAELNIIPMATPAPAEAQIKVSSDDDNERLKRIRAAIGNELSPSYDLADFSGEKLQSYFANAKTKLLLELPTASDFDALAATLKGDLDSLFWIDSADDLYDQAYAVSTEQNKLKQISGHLLNFFTAAQNNSEKKYYLCINWSRFSAREIAGYQSLLDDTRKWFDDITVPDNITIIGVTNRHQAQGLREDFHSRHEQQLTLTGSSQQKTPTTATKNSDPYEIDLYASPTYNEMLLGKVKITADGVAYEDGALIKAIKNKRTNIVINNGPTHLRSFQLFMARIAQKQPLLVQGAYYSLNGINISFTDEADYEKELSNISFNTDVKWNMILTEYNYQSFFQQIHIDKSNNIRQQPGWLEQYADQPLNLLVDGKINKSQYARMIAVAAEYNCTLNFCLFDKTAAAEKNSNAKVLLTNKTELFAQVNLLRQTKDYNNALFVPVSDKMAFSDLIQTVDEIDFENVKITLRNSEIYTKLLADKTVVLYGDLSAQLIKELETIWTQDPYLEVNGEHVKLPGKLTWVTAKKDLPDFLAKKELAPVAVPAAPAIKRFSTANIDHDTDASEWLKQRQNMVKEALASNVITFLQGPTASGKTTFVRRELPTIFPRANLYSGIEKLSDWASDNHEGEKFLFIDEANLDRDLDWYSFSGLYSDKPGILINGKHYPLTDRHKIIIAGNPASYEGRKLPQFFQEHPPSEIYFDTLPASFIENIVLPPCFPHAASREANIAIIMQAYQFLLTNTDLTTPRLLQTLALLLAAHSSAENSAPAPSSYQLIASLGIKLEHADAAIDDELPESNGFIFRPCHQPLIQAIDALLKIRDYKIKQQQSDNNSLSPLGQRGLLLEGPSGIGKSTVVIKRLEDRGYVSAATEDKITSSKRYYHLTGQSLAEMFTLIEKAAQEGAILIIDELNLLPIEKQLNAALDQIQEREGFMVIATQNGTNLPGRIPLSDALTSRLLKLTMPDYDDQDLHAILATKYPTLNKTDLATLIKYRKELFLKTSTLRDLSHVAQSICVSS